MAIGQDLHLARHDEHFASVDEEMDLVVEAERYSCCAALFRV